MADRTTIADLRRAVESLSDSLPDANIMLHGANGGWQILWGMERPNRRLTHGYLSKPLLYSLAVAMNEVLAIRRKIEKENERREDWVSAVLDLSSRHTKKTNTKENDDGAKIM